MSGLRPRHASTIAVLIAALGGAAVAATATAVSGPARPVAVAGIATPDQIVVTTPRPSPRQADPPPTPATTALPTTTSQPTTSAPPPPSTTTPTLTTTTGTPPPTTTATKPPPGPTGIAAQVLDLVNAERSRAGCAAARLESRLVDAAAGHSGDMARRGYLSHTTPEGVTFDVRIRQAGYPKPGAENIARGQRTAEQVMNSWMNSPGHRRNILDCSLIAMGIALDTNGFYWTQTFGR
ncbi:uncharacterized protein YkwD [Herbihabitans rhizosphaerae]|uniref:Uncharacterized protein YkwD n=1 Tax=Herbihabitans rhizosphaerae TaxID=1872711 RepID=A0A4Q7KS37_9PSEU|nr:CAP domain-containing protein [Herbihabitans rhizosphaerae]RZS39317.1 uncharacterized protein YkwD [Herbihabitans rhizosphaerae]